MRLALPLWVYRIPLVRRLCVKTVWRWLERETGQPDTKGPPSYQYGKVTGLHPDVLVMTQTSESPYVCCGYCTAGMACRTARTGLSDKMAQTAHPIRNAGGRPHNNGNNASELRVGAWDAFGVDLDSIAISEIPDRLRKGFAVTVGLQYADLPSYLKVQGGDFGHAVMLRGWDEPTDRVGFFDPLWPQGARGAWANWADVKRALWSDGNHSTTKTVVAEPEPEPEPEPPDTAGGPPPPGYRDGYVAGFADGVASEADRTFASWFGVPVPDSPPGVTWGSDTCVGAKWDRHRWSHPWPVPMAAVAVAEAPAAWDIHSWTAGLWT